MKLPSASGRGWRRVIGTSIADFGICSALVRPRTSTLCPSAGSQTLNRRSMFQSTVPSPLAVYVLFFQKEAIRKILFGVLHSAASLSKALSFLRPRSHSPASLPATDAGWLQSIPAMSRLMRGDGTRIVTICRFEPHGLRSSVFSTPYRGSTGKGRSGRTWLGRRPNLVILLTGGAVTRPTWRPFHRYLLISTGGCWRCKRHSVLPAAIPYRTDESPSGWRMSVWTSTLRATHFRVV